MNLLDSDLIEDERLEIATAPRERSKLRRAGWIAGALLLVIGGIGLAGVLAWRDYQRAQSNVTRARQAMDELVAFSDHGRTGVEAAQADDVTRERLANAEGFYKALVNQRALGEGSRRDLALVHLQLGHVYRIGGHPGEASREYEEAIARLKDLAGSHPENPAYRATVANAFHWLGETLRQSPATYDGAEQAFNSAFQLLQQLVQESAANVQYQQDLARTHFSRGLLRSAQARDPAAADLDFREASRLLEPIAATDDHTARALARAHYQRGALLAQDPERGAEARTFWEKAIGVDERLVIKNPADREAKLELASFCNDLAALLGKLGNIDEADRRSRMAIDLFENLARATPSLAVARADAHRLRGALLQGDDAAEAADEYRLALDLFSELQNDRTLHRVPEFHARLADLLLNLAAFPPNSRESREVRGVLAEAVRLYAVIAAKIVSSGSRPEAQHALDNLTRVLDGLPEPHRSELAEFSQQLKRRLESDQRP